VQPGRVLIAPGKDEATCVVFGMPRAAIEHGAVDEVLPLSRIAHAVLARAGVA